MHKNDRSNQYYCSMLWVENGGEKAKTRVPENLTTPAHGGPCITRGGYQTFSNKQKDAASTVNSRRRRGGTGEGERKL